MRTLSLKQNKSVSRYVLSSLIAVLLLLALLPAVAADKGDESIKILQQMGKAFAGIAEKASPAVVSIKANQQVSQEYSGAPDWPSGDPFGDDFWERFFGRPYRYKRSPQPKALRPVEGSGFIVSSDGYILTNNHVVQDAEDITVTLRDGREFKAKTIGTDPQNEVAVIKIDSEKLPVLELADSDKLEVGEWVIAIGNPFGLSHTVTQGIVSAKGRSNIRLASYEDYIQTDAAINPGNSGGPLINLSGEVVGINTAIIGPGGNIGIGFAIPINMAKFSYTQLIEGGKVVRGALGIQIDDLDADLAKSLGVKETKGVVIGQVSKNSAAEKAGLERYDVIVELNGDKIESANELRNKVAMLKPGTKAKIVVVRKGERKTIYAELGDSTEELKAFATPAERLEQLGLAVQNLTDDLARRYGYEGLSGVIVTQVKSDSEAARKGIEPGMLIMEVDQQPMRNTKDFDEAINKAAEKGQALLLITDGRFSYLAVLKLGKEKE
ncbi:MAG TPA: DegQ family serine endoprotease [Sedimentisphaerales bacterium]|nr:DegQ family serine endoprotease [Sedimentisphaerales bacterium]